MGSQWSAVCDQTRFAKWWRAGAGEPRGFFFEVIIEHTYRYLMNVGDRAIDCGANCGHHTIPMAEAVGSTGRVIAIEANPLLAEELKEKVPQQVDVLSTAIGNREGITEFCLVQADLGLSGIKQDYFKDPRVRSSIKWIKAPITTIDEIVSRPLFDSKQRFFKMDIEGGEFHALNGALRTMRRDRPFIIFESGRSGHAELYGYSKGDWFGFFSKLGYEVFDLFGRRFTEESWTYGDDDQIPWYFIATGSESDADYVLKRHSDTIQGALVDFQNRVRPATMMERLARLWQSVGFIPISPC